MEETPQALDRLRLCEAIADFKSLSGLYDNYQAALPSYPISTSPCGWMYSAIVLWCLIVGRLKEGLVEVMLARNQSKRREVETIIHLWIKKIELKVTYAALYEF